MCVRHLAQTACINEDKVYLSRQFITCVQYIFFEFHQCELNTGVLH